MSITKTIGGDRLGAGKKMKTTMHGFERSTQNLDYVFRSTMSAGTLVPFMKTLALPGDTFDIDLNVDVMTHPTVGPLFGSYKVQLDVFQCPIRLYNAQLHNNKLGIGMKMDTVKFPIFNLRAPSTQGLILADGELPDINNYQVNPSSILAYLGIRGAGTNMLNTTEPNEIFREFNALAWLGYWDIYKNYYANKQEEIGYVIHTEPIDTDQQIDTMDIEGLPIGTPTSPQPPAPVQNGDTLLINLIGATEQDETQVMLLIGTTTMSPQLYALNTIATQLTFGAGQQTFQMHSLPGYGVRTVYSWEYTSGVLPTQKPIELQQFSLNSIDDIREAILAHSGATPFNIVPSGLLYEPFLYALQENANGSMRSITQSQEGLGIKTYQSDLLNNWISTEWIDGTGGISEITAVDTTSGSFTMDTLLMAKKVYDMLNRVALSGGSYDDWLEVQYDHEQFTRAETPIYHGGLIRELVFQEVISNSEAGGEGGQPLGTLAGKGTMGQKKKGGSVTIKVNEPSYIIGIVSLTPRIDYSQGNDWDVHLKTMGDLHVPSMDEIGFQELITEQMAWWDTQNDGVPGGGTWITKSAGKQPAWINYMTEINRTYGNFAIRSNEMFMTLNRNYSAEQIGTGNQIKIQDLTTYIDPRIYNQIFADTSLDSQNFWTQIGVNRSGRRKISAKVMPNL